MEESITGDYALVKAWKADKAGNLIFRYFLHLLVRGRGIKVKGNFLKIVPFLSQKNSDEFQPTDV